MNSNKEASKMAIAALRAQQQPEKNDPLRLACRRARAEAVADPPWRA